MPAKPTEKQITFFLEAEDRNQFQQLCKTTGISASMVLRSWVLAALKEQRIEMNVTPEATTTTAPQVVNSSISDSQLKNILQRLDSLERQQPLLEKEELMFMKDEVLGDDMGTIRNRLGVVETQLQAMGGSIAWNKVVKDAEESRE